MNRITLATILAVLGIGTYLAVSSIYTVSEVEQAIITQFGKPVGDPVTTAGLKVKAPFIQDVNLIDKRVLGCFHRYRAVHLVKIYQTPQGH
jgi:modulator of FtsH protease HflC